MRFELTDSARADIRRLSASDLAAFKDAARSFSVAADRHVAALGRGPAGQSRWPASLRVKPVQGADGVVEMTWSFTGPDGRATWEWRTITLDGVPHPAVRWRRVGDHRILRDP